jgi:hypothetical protein
LHLGSYLPSLNFGRSGEARGAAASESENESAIATATGTVRTKIYWGLSELFAKSFKGQFTLPRIAVLWAQGRGKWMPILLENNAETSAAAEIKQLTSKEQAYQVIQVHGRLEPGDEEKFIEIALTRVVQVL